MGPNNQRKQYLSGCNASSSAWSQGLCTTWWPHSLSFHHLYVVPVRNPRSEGKERNQTLRVKLLKLVKQEGKNLSAFKKGRTIQHFHRYTSCCMFRMHGKHSKYCEKCNYKKQNKNTPPRYLAKSNRNKCPQNDLRMNIHSSLTRPQTLTEANVYQ